MNTKTIFLVTHILIPFILFNYQHSKSQVTLEWAKKYNGYGINKGDIGSAITTDQSGNVYVTGQVQGYGMNYDYATIKYNNSGVQQWLTKYHGPRDTSNNYADAITVDLSGNVYITGLSAEQNGLTDFATIKYNSNGVQQWLARYNGPGNSNDNGRAIVLDDSGNVYVTGESYNTSSLYDYATVKYNSSGVQQWASIFNGPGNNTDEPSGLAVDQAGNVYVTGYSINSNVTEYATIKYNAAGVQQWVSIYNGTGNTTSIANGITVDHNGFVYVTGRSNQTGTNYDIVTIKYNPSTGDSVWVRKFNSQSNFPDYGYGITVDKYNNIYVCGAYNNLNNSTWGIVDIKYNSSGVQQWATIYTPTGRQSSYATKILVDSSGNTYLSGYSLVSAYSLHTEDYLTAKFDSNGVMQWINFYNGPGNDRDEGYGIAIDNSGNSFITGLSYAGYLSGTCDYATIKYNSAGAQQWVERYNNTVNGNDYISAIKIGKSGNIYVAGSSDGQASGSDILLIKFNPNGDTLWTAKFNSIYNSNDNATCMDIDSSENIYVGGSSWAPDFEENQYVALKFNSSGNLLWSSLYDGGGYAYIPNSIASDANGNIYEFGATGYGGIHGNFLLIKFDSNGDTVWSRSIGNNPTGTLAKKVVADKSGYIYVTGRISNDILTIKFDPAGDTLWSARYNGTGNSTDEPNDMCLDISGNIYVTGYSRQSTNYGSEDYVTIKYNSSGVQQWAELYNGPGNYYDAAKSIFVDSLKNVFVTGVSYGNGTNYDFATVKYDSMGNTKWVERFNGASNDIDIGTNVLVDGKGNTIVGGCSRSSSYNSVILKYDTAGIQKWFSQYNTNSDSTDLACLIALDNNGNYYLGSSTFENGTDFDILLAKYSDLIGISNKTRQIPLKFSLDQNYPNPFNPSTTIKFALPKDARVTIKIYDILGREILTLINDEYKKAGYYEEKFDGSNFASGVYFYKIESTSGVDKFVQTRKMVLIK